MVRYCRSTPSASDTGTANGSVIPIKAVWSVSAEVFLSITLFTSCFQIPFQVGMSRFAALSSGPFISIDLQRTFLELFDELDPDMSSSSVPGIRTSTRLQMPSKPATPVNPLISDSKNNITIAAACDVENATSSSARLVRRTWKSWISNQSKSLKKKQTEAGYYLQSKLVKQQDQQVPTPVTRSDASRFSLLPRLCNSCDDLAFGTAQGKAWELALAGYPQKSTLSRPPPQLRYALHRVNVVAVGFIATAAAYQLNAGIDNGPRLRIIRPPLCPIPVLRTALPSSILPDRLRRYWPRQTTDLQLRISLRPTRPPSRISRPFAE
ncbi:uncharacterized protein MYCGRDRAFT_97736 [Zymoseptoria tritici IPO323]|uniref:Uncharacterized protein n=1 Tax=Zymoseptoria tritici (strain CBS 115943 / IPO323) TaxID=336722 RepID=F9XR77_ZYMTI|nr:uncharacterized protein MYCGRDRAFT_97736 [Zymoseptoria tritici IPO323]EGP82210.1 hypothetical protein MYCGRDRAFT_97736 [Zymoseptoria tritici IPO323]